MTDEEMRVLKLQEASKLTLDGVALLVGLASENVTNSRTKQILMDWAKRYGKLRLTL